MPQTSGAQPKRRANTDTVKLLMLGYRQELVREFTLFNSFGSSLVALCPMAALGGTFGIGIGYTYGGPVVMMWGWLLVMFFSMSVGLSMAELASAYPTSGALYYWSYKLAPPRLRNLACWMTAWILVLGQVALSASVFYTFVQLIQAAATQASDASFNELQRFGLLSLAILVVGLLNCGSARMTAFLTTVGTLWSVIGLVAFSMAVVWSAHRRQGAKYVFTSWEPNHDSTGITSPVYTILVGLLMSQWSFTGFDGAAHLSEETLNAEFTVPYGILLAILGSGATGYLFMLALTFVRMDETLRYDPQAELHGFNVVLQILTKLSRDAHSHAGTSVALFTVPIVATFFCSVQSIANNSRMLYAFARDGAVPLCKYAKRIVPRTQAPTYGMLYMLAASGALSVPMCFNAYAFQVVTSFAVLACYTAYVMPVMCKLWTGRRVFLPGPFYLGPRLSYINNMVSVSWVLMIITIATLPTTYPVTAANCNWSGPSLAGVVLLLLAWYFMPKHGARHWFTGPRANLGRFQDVLPSELARRAEQAAAGTRIASVTAVAAAAAVAASMDSNEPDAASSLREVMEEAAPNGPGGSGVVFPSAAAAAVAAAARAKCSSAALHEVEGSGAAETDGGSSSSSGDTGSSIDLGSHRATKVSSLPPKLSDNWAAAAAALPTGVAAVAAAARSPVVPAAAAAVAARLASDACRLPSTSSDARTQASAGAAAYVRSPGSASRGDEGLRRQAASGGLFLGRGAGMGRLQSSSAQGGDSRANDTLRRRSRSSSRRSLLATSGPLLTAAVSTGTECPPDSSSPSPHSSAHIAELLQQLVGLSAGVASQGGRRIRGDGRGPGGLANRMGYLLASAELLSSGGGRSTRDRVASLRQLSYNRHQFASGRLDPPGAGGGGGGGDGSLGAGAIGEARGLRPSCVRQGPVRKEYGRCNTASGLTLCVQPDDEEEEEGEEEDRGAAARGPSLLALAHTHTAQRWRSGLAGTPAAATAAIAATAATTTACLMATADDVRQLFPAVRRSTCVASITGADDLLLTMQPSTHGRLAHCEVDGTASSPGYQSDPRQSNLRSDRRSLRAALRGAVSVVAHAPNERLAGAPTEASSPAARVRAS